jgi:UDP-N-acetylglucosamine--N-acetylmuramyl-(pentapeptide) pyrophosphoryl-undecaprenol N-acetylglucosamine transferase
VTGRRRIESEILTRYGFQQTAIAIEGLKGRGWKKGAFVIFRLPFTFGQSVSVVRRFSPRTVIGVGGYSAGPVCLAARLLGISTAIHEQNSYPGLTNRLLSRVVDKIFISFPESAKHFPAGEPILTGNPIREDLLAGKTAGDDGPKTFTALIVGGSQGARAINRVVVDALGVLKEKGREPAVIHQSGVTDHQEVTAAYRDRGLTGEVRPFIQDMAAAYHRADLVVSRAGATTIFELAALGKPSILIPYPYAANSHQETNALALVRAGGAEMVLEDDLNGERLAALLLKYMDDRTALRQMGRQARTIGQPDAAKRVVDQLEAELS